MVTAASIFSWLGGIITTFIGFVNVARGFDVPVTYYHCNGYGCSYSTGTQHQASPAWLWVLWIIFVIVRFIILLWRQSSVANGRKVACGVCTLLFASLIGGILTLCIPEDELG